MAQIKLTRQVYVHTRLQGVMEPFSMSVGSGGSQLRVLLRSAIYCALAALDFLHSAARAGEAPLGRRAHQAAGGDEALLHQRGQRRLAVEGVPPREPYERWMPRNPAAGQAQNISMSRIAR